VGRDAALVARLSWRTPLRPRRGARGQRAVSSPR
jgi:hypothetical protein